MQIPRNRGIFTINFKCIKRLVAPSISRRFKNSQRTIDKLWNSHIGTILDFSSEGKKSESDFNRVMNETIASIKKAKSEDSIPFSVFKPTGLARFSLLEKINRNIRYTYNDV